MSIRTRSSLVYNNVDVLRLEYRSDMNFNSELGGFGLCSNMRTGSSGKRGDWIKFLKKFHKIKPEQTHAQSALQPRSAVPSGGGNGALNRNAIGRVPCHKDNNDNANVTTRSL